MSMAFDIDWPGFNVKTFSLCSSCITGNGWCLVCLGQGKEPKWMNLHMRAFYMRNWEDFSDVWSTGKWNEWGNVILHVELVLFQRRRWCFDRRRFIFLFVFF
jgi:hypothetical protein